MVCITAFAGGVHAMQSHAAAIANIVSEAGIPVVVHAVCVCLLVLELRKETIVRKIDTGFTSKHWDSVLVCTCCPVHGWARHQSHRCRTKLPPFLEITERKCHRRLVVRSCTHRPLPAPISICEKITPPCMPAVFIIASQVL